MWYAYRVSDGRFLRGLASLRPEYDPATEAVAEYAERDRPDMRRHRYDGNAPDHKRAATAQEVADFDAERQDTTSAAQFDGQERKLVKALAIWAAQKLNVPLATARAEILAIFKTL